MSERTPKRPQRPPLNIPSNPVIPTVTGETVLWERTPDGGHTVTHGQPQTQYYMQQYLLDSGALRNEDGMLVLNKGYIELTEQEWKYLNDFGYPVPAWNEIQKSQKLYHGNFLEQYAFQLSTATGQIISDVAGLFNFIDNAGLDIFNLIPDKDIKFEGIKMEDYLQWTNANPSDFDRGTVVAANMSLALAEAYVTGQALSAVTSFTFSGLSKISQYIANNRYLSSILAKTPSFKYGTTTASNVLKWAQANPDIAYILVSTPSNAMEMATVATMINSGASFDEIMMQVGKYSAFEIGMTLGALDYVKYSKSKGKGKQFAKDTKFEFVPDENGNLKIGVTLDNYSDDVMEVFETKFDKDLGKRVVTGSWGDDPVDIAVTSTFTDDFDDIGKAGLTLSDDVVKTNLIDDLTDSQRSLLKSQGYNLDLMTPDEIMEAKFLNNIDIPKGYTVEEWLEELEMARKQGFIVKDGKIVPVGKYNPQTRMWEYKPNPSSQDIENAVKTTSKQGTQQLLKVIPEQKIVEATEQMSKELALKLLNEAKQQTAQSIIIHMATANVIGLLPQTKEEAKENDQKTIVGLILLSSQANKVVPALSVEQLINLSYALTPAQAVALVQKMTPLQKQELLQILGRLPLPLRKALKPFHKTKSKELEYIIKFKVTFNNKKTFIEEAKSFHSAVYKAQQKIDYHPHHVLVRRYK